MGQTLDTSSSDYDIQIFTEEVMKGATFIAPVLRTVSSSNVTTVTILTIVTGSVSIDTVVPFIVTYKYILHISATV